MSERIEGKHHYAVRESNDGGTYFIYRNTGGHAVAVFTQQEWDEGDVLNHYDELANHFIQQGREEAFAEVDELADGLDNFWAYRHEELDNGWRVNHADSDAHGVGDIFTAALRAAVGGEE